VEVLMFNNIRVAWVLLMVPSLTSVARLSEAQNNEEKPVVAKAASAKFGTVPNAPECFTVSVDKGDPSKGPSVILAKFAPLRAGVSPANAYSRTNVTRGGKNV
jgi:hypothetical protein